MAEQVQSGPQQSRARRFLGAGKRTLDGEDRSERIKTGRKGTPFRAFSPTIKPEFPQVLAQGLLTGRTPSFAVLGDWGVGKSSLLLKYSAICSKPEHAMLPVFF